MYNNGVVINADNVEESDWGQALWEDEKDTDTERERE